jgi:3-isopropylmalate/(R)-2-methylmalate dehydratase small subunit|tara:strand:+ start:506 stop:1117 length:612 start_codon:yes stop_codon:yes gene_type:complete
LTLESGTKLEKFKKIISVITPFDKANVDTDQIVPKQFLKLIQKVGFGKYLFYNWRFESDGSPKKDFILNNSKYSNSKILVTNENFGCGSSREHAVWALKDFGFSVIIAPSFADIFYSNCFKNGVLAIEVDRNIVKRIFADISELEIDLENQTITGHNIQEHFDIQSDKKRRLLEGLDDISLTMQSKNAIDVFEKNSKTPSIFN